MVFLFLSKIGYTWIWPTRTKIKLKGEKKNYSPNAGLYIESHRLVDFDYGSLTIQKNEKNFSYYSLVNYYETNKRKDTEQLLKHILYKKKIQLILKIVYKLNIKNCSKNKSKNKLQFLPCHLKYLGQYKLNKAAIQQPSLKSPKSWAKAINGILLRCKA